MSVRDLTVAFCNSFFVYVFLNNDLLKTFSCDRILENKL